MTKRPRIVSHALLCAATLLVASCSQGGYEASPKDTDWAWYGNDREEQRFSSLSQINAENVGDLGLAWSLDLPGENALQATPIEVGGVLYFSGGLSKVYAVNAVTGELLWSYDPEVGKADPSRIRAIFSVNRGVAYWDGKVYAATKDGRMVALDARTGQPVWIKPFLRAGDGSVSTGAPRILDGKVIIGNSGAEMSVRGYVTALDAKTGDLAWRFFTVPGNPAVDRDETTQRAAKTWTGEWWKYGGGGTVWSGITYDSEFRQVLIGTGNGAPYNPDFRCKNGEDNLYLSSVVALDADTGKYKWHYQYNPCEVWDWKATSDIVLGTLTIEGKPRKVLMQAPSNGFFYVIDRSNGKLISAEPYGKQNWAERIDLATGRPVEKPGIRFKDKPAVIYPGAYGAHNWQPTSFSPRSGLVYIPYMQTGLTYSRTDAKDVTDRPGQRTTRLGVAMAGPGTITDPMDYRGSLIALDPVTQKIKWRVDHETMWNSGLVSTAGDLVFQGANTGKFRAYDARNGKKLWEFDAKLGIIAPAITYAIGGRQYVSVLVGPGGSTGEATLPEFVEQGWKYGLQPRRILTFALGATAKLPETPPRDVNVEIPVVPGFVPDRTAIARGGSLYERNCYFCHGMGAHASGGAPDLRGSGIAADLASFGMVLRTGALAANGMPRFEEFSDADVRDLYQYIRSEAEVARAKSKTQSK